MQSNLLLQFWLSKGTLRRPELSKWNWLEDLFWKRENSVLWFIGQTQMENDHMKDEILCGPRRPKWVLFTNLVKLMYFTHKNFSKSGFSSNRAAKCSKRNNKCHPTEISVLKWVPIIYISHFLSLNMQVIVNVE